MTDQLRLEVAFAGFTEALTFALCSRDDISTSLRKDLTTLPAVHISNPKAFEFQASSLKLLWLLWLPLGCTYNFIARDFEDDICQQEDATPT